MRFSGVTIALLHPFKTDLIFPVAPKKTDRSARSLCNTIYSDVGASD